MGLVDAVLDCLRDGQRHDLNELSTKEQLRKKSITTLMITLEFLADYDFIELSQGLKKGDPPIPIMDAKLHPAMHDFLRKIRWIERSERRRP